MLSKVLLTAMVTMVSGQGNIGNLYTTLSSDGNMYAMSMMSVVQGNMNQSFSYAAGDRSLTPSDSMSTTSPMRAGGLAEMLVVAAALKMNVISQSLTSQVPKEYIPNELDLRNPNSNTKVISYQMLMQHTSSLSDNSFSYGSIDTPTCTQSTGQCSGAASQEFRPWMEEKFVQNGNELAASLFQSNTEPGTYTYAKINIALLVFIMDKIIEADTNLVSSTTKNAQQYIIEQIIVPLGMSSTFWLNRDGTIPTSGNNALSPYLYSMVREYEGTSDYYGTHPNNPADFMMWTTVHDMIKFANAVLAPLSGCTSTTLCTIGNDMKTKNTFETTTNGRTYQTQQGLGLQYYNPEQICAQTSASSNLYSKCPLKAGDNVWGFMTGDSSTDLSSIAGVLCTDSSGNTAAASCVVVQLANRVTGSALTPLNAFSVAGAAFQESFGEVTAFTTTGGNSDNDLYGLWVCLGVVGTVAFVIAMSYFTELFIQPPPPVGPVAFKPNVEPAPGLGYPTNQ
eukprot:TRINITY_DN1897_c0_g1_i1.p1 TRINITY_DN1897_c0_g1~~TRINITY_DN1897_c0_g1_i1.p1  ORF type:complete len:522 (+),score=114.17 TRINITY_DN1897_c0_g1_i1:44-1567(+)